MYFQQGPPCDVQHIIRNIPLESKQITGYCFGRVKAVSKFQIKEFFFFFSLKKKALLALWIIFFYTSSVNSNKIGQVVPEKS